jgi:pimeloyl-ACP methyl ester carboxylesterase
METDPELVTFVPNPEISPVLEPAEQIKVALRDVNPENPAVAVIEGALGKLWYRLGFVTRPKENAAHAPTLPDRFERAQKYHEAKKAKLTPIGSPERQTVFEENARFRKIESEFLDQKSLALTHPEWGNLSACYTILNREAGREKPPIVLISGASNGVESVDSLVRKMAERYPDRQIYVLGYPDAPSGVMTKEFFDAVENDKGFKPHSQFFEATINHLIPEGDIELWGFSAGGAIAETLLAETSIAKRVSDVAVLMCPGGSVEMSPKKFAAGLIADNILLLTKLKNIAKYVFIDDPTPTTEDQKRWKFDTWVALGDKCRLAASEKLLPKISENMKPGTKMVSVSGDVDFITRSAEFFNPKKLMSLKKILPNLEVDVVKGAPHTGPFIYPDKFIDAIDKQLHR